MFKTALTTVILLISTVARAQMVVGNGGGLIENQLVYVWTNLSTYLKPCLGTKACGLTADEKKIVSVIAQEFKNKPLIFLRQSERLSLKGKFFETDVQVGAQVYINLDYLYLDGERILLDKRDFHEAVLQLVAAKSFQHGLTLENSYVVGRKVADLARTQVSHIGLLSLGFPMAGFSVFSSENASLVFISDSQEMYELTDLIAAQAPCSDARITETTNLYWSHFTDTEAVAKGQLFGNCLGQLWRADFEIKLNYMFLDSTTISRQLIFNPKKTVVSIFDFEMTGL